MNTLKVLLRGDNLSLVRQNKFGLPNFTSQTDLEKLSTAKTPGKGSAKVIGFHLLVDENECDKIPELAQDHLRWTPQGVFTKNSDLAIYLIQFHGAVFIQK